MTPADIDRDAELIYDYHRMRMPLAKADAIFCLCSLDTRVAERAAELYLAGYGKYLIFSGGSGKLTAFRFDKPEAEIFAGIAINRGVPAEAILMEPNSTNTGENMLFTHRLLSIQGLKPASFVLVQKPYMERRTYATFKRQWPDQSTDFTVTSPQLGFHEYPNEQNPKDFVIHIMVGDLVRLHTYPAKGFQIVQDIPPEVWAAGQRLIKAGFTNHLPA